ncbi:MAG: DUF3108 domain-containing protein [Rikenellaceae bacterium]|nr:DUF3108 domain-containing protein [Rikenellaceae bacterium]
MKRFLSLIVILLLNVESFAQKESQQAFNPGERLRYLLRYQWASINTDVGDVVFTLDQMKDSSRLYYIARATGKSFKFYDIFFKVRDYYESRFYPDGMIPVYFHRDVLEGKYRMINHIYFFKDNRIKASYKKREAPFRDTLHKVETKTFDLLSLVYAIRNDNFSTKSIGEGSRASFAIDGKIYSIKYIYSGTEIKKVSGLGVFNTYKIEVKAVSGHAFKGSENITIWISADENRVPVQIETPIQVGNVMARLIEFSNLKYPLKSKIK